MKIRKSLLILASSLCLVACAVDENNDASENKVSSQEDTTDHVETKTEEQALVQENSTVWENQNKEDFDLSFPEGKFKEYSPSGHLLLEGELIDFQACLMAGGTWKYYAQDEILEEEIIYHVYNGEDSTCHDTQVDLEVYEYYSSGQIKAVKTIHSCYECSQFKAGVWTFYNEEGSIDSTQAHDGTEEIIDTYY